MELGSGVVSQPVTSGRWFKVGVGVSLFCGCLALVSIAVQSRTSADESTDLAALSPFLRASSLAAKPSMVNLPGSGPFKEMALTALKASDLGNRPRDVAMAAAKMKDIYSKMNNEDKAIVVKAEEAVKLNAKEMPGVTAPLGFFDPLGFSTDCEAGRLLFFREVELKHGRVGMLASLGFIVGENFHPLFGGNIDVPSYIAFQQTPLQTFWIAVALAIGVLELESINSFQPALKSDDQIYKIRTDRVPGDLGFDPLGMKPKDDKGLLELQNKELNNGRLAMLAAAGMIAQELATGKKLF